MKCFVALTRAGAITARARNFTAKRHLRGFSGEKSGAVAIIFALSILPILCFIGAATDFGRALDVQARMNQAADAAALAYITRSSNPMMVLPDQDSVTDYFKASVGKLPANVTYTVTAAPTTSVNSLFVTVSYRAAIPTTIMQIVGMRTMNVAGSASAVAQYPKYLDFYLLLDNSPSMGLAATTTDIANLQARTGGCAFACHQYSFDGNGKIKGDNNNDNYHIAQKYNITTRIDVLRTATQQLTTTASSAETLPDQFRMAVYTFSDVFQRIATLTNNLNSVQSSASSIDLAYAYQNERDAQTDFSSAFSYMNAIIPSPGDGSTTATPMNFLFLVTDGVEDKPVKSASGNGNTPDYYKNGSTGWPANTQNNVANTQSGNVSSTRLIGTLNPALCDTLKNRGTKIAVLYTTYLPVPTNSFYNQWVKPLTNSIPTNLQSCASPGLYFEVSPSGGISDAMQQMFQSALSTARLTR